MNCAERVARKIREKPEGLALWTIDEGATSMRDMGRLVASAQTIFRREGIGAGDSVIVVALPGPQLYAAFVALLGLGATAVLVEPWMPVANIDHVVRKIAPKAFIASTIGKAWGVRVASIRAIAKWIAIGEVGRAPAGDLVMEKVDRDVPAMITFTSGTTGAPKGIVRSHGYMEDAHLVLTRNGTWDQFDGPDLAVFPGIAMFHLGTGRGALLVPPRWRADDLARMAALPDPLQPLTVSCGPAFLAKLLEVPGFTALRTMYIGGALSDCAVVERACARWPNANVWHIYGGTEAEPVALVDAREAVKRSRARGLHQVLFLGAPIEEISARPKPEGLWVAGVHVCPEYIGADEENRQVKSRDPDGTLWHFMGDRIDVDTDGWWYGGRATQPAGDFALEQRVYTHLGSSASFIERDASGARVLVGEGVAARDADVRARFPEIARVREARIVRDRRHRARIDRAASSRGPSMTRWLTYLKERSPLPLVVLIGFGAALSACALGRHALDAAHVGLMMLGLVPFLVLARLMDERKDFEKDKLAHPTRPLPRGLLSPREVERAIALGAIASLVLAGVFAAIASPLAGGLYAATIAFLWLMYREFYLGERLAKHPVTYAALHQLVIVPLYAFAISVASPDAVFTRIAAGYLVANLGGGMAYEIARKLDPEAHPALRTYLLLYGRARTALLLIASLAVAGVGAWLLGLGKYLWPVEAYAALHLGLIWAQPKRFKLVDGAFGLTSLLHLWSVVIAYWVGWW